MKRTGVPTRGGQHRRRTSPYLLFSVLALLTTAVAGGVLHVRFGVTLAFAYLIGINLGTLVLYAYDKAAGGRGGWTRVPERVLHGAALLGGTPAALLSQLVLRHKTVKRTFRVAFIAICAAQLFALVAWAYWRYREGIPW